MLVSGAALNLETAAYLFWIAGVWFTYWSVGWLVSSFNTQGVSMARRAHFALAFLIVLVPMPVIAYFNERTDTNLFLYYPPAVIVNHPISGERVFALGCAFFVMAAVFTYIGERRRRSSVLSKEAEIGKLAY